MPFRRKLPCCLCLLTFALVIPPDAVRAQDTPADAIPTPESVIGHPVGADYKLARWAQIVDYFRQLGAASERVNVRTLDRQTTEGNDYLLCEISSPETLADLDRYRAYQSKLADPRLIGGDDDRREVLEQAKTTVIVACGLHSSEVSASQMSMELAYELASRDDDRVREILDNCIILLVPCANPDGLDKIVDWYERNLGTPYEGAWMPWLYQKYAGHDNNRDWFMLNLRETRILTEVLYYEWHPTILHDVHQMGNRGARFFVPPFFDPVNPNVDPLIHQSLLLIGGHMATELQENGKTGVVFKAIFDNWWQGGNRTTPYRHNIVGILTEAASAKFATPIFQEYDDLRGGGRGFPEYAPLVNFPEPWPGGWWRLRDAVEYQKISNMALFTLAARYRQSFVRNHLTLSEKAIRLGEEEPPYAWVVPAHQRDPSAAAHMLEVLRLSGLEVHRATAPFTADGAEYPDGTHILYTAQPYRPHLMDMMERQDYPERRQYPGGPAEPPYDSAGWTLPLQMGVSRVAVVRPFEAEAELLDEPIVATRVQPALGSHPAAWYTKRQGNGDYAAVNALLKDGYLASVAREPVGEMPAGSIVITLPSGPAGEQPVGGRADPTLLARLHESVRGIQAERPARFEPLAEAPDPAGLMPMRAPRTALYQPWTSNMDEGWTRFVLDSFDFPYETVHNAEIRAGNLRARFDCVIIPDMRASRLLSGVSDKDAPPPYAGGIGLDGALELERFVEAGGTLVLMDSATELATETLRLPVRNVLDGLQGDEFFCPGSLLRVRVDNTHPLGYGMPDEVAAYFARSRAFEVEGGRERGNKGSREQRQGSGEQGNEGSEARDSKPPTVGNLDREHPVTTVARYSDNIVLLSGWILGEEHVRNRAAVCEIGVGDGQVVLLGFRVQHRGQPWGTFKLLFNAIYRSGLDGA